MLNYHNSKPQITLIIDIEIKTLVTGKYCKGSKVASNWIPSIFYRITDHANMSNIHILYDAILFPFSILYAYPFFC